MHFIPINSDSKFTLAISDRISIKFPKLSPKSTFFNLLGARYKRGIIIPDATWFFNSIFKSKRYQIN